MVKKTQTSDTARKCSAWLLGDGQCTRGDSHVCPRRRPRLPSAQKGGTVIGKRKAVKRKSTIFNRVLYESFSLVNFHNCFQLVSATSPTAYTRTHLIFRVRNFVITRTSVITHVDTSIALFTAKKHERGYSR